VYFREADLKEILAKVKKINRILAIMKAHYHRRALSTESARWFNPNIAMT